MAKELKELLHGKSAASVSASVTAASKPTPPPLKDSPSFDPSLLMAS